MQQQFEKQTEEQEVEWEAWKKTAEAEGTVRG